MSGDDRVAANGGPSADGATEKEPGGLHRLMKALFDRTPWGKRLNRFAESVRDLRRQLHETNLRIDALTDRLEARLDVLEDNLRRTQSSIDESREAGDARLDAAESALAAISDEANRLRDDVVPAMVGRSDALLERLVAEIDEVGSLVERVLRREPLPAAAGAVETDSGLAKALAEVQPDLLAAFRGPESEIRHRLEHYLEPLRTTGRVLDLGCGRGELLLMLREAGVEAVGIEGDPAVVEATRRRGLEVIEGDVLEALRGQPDESRDAVTAIHLFEHLEPTHLAVVIAEVRRVLSPGGLFIVECPNPTSLRVGAAMFWIDPTHRRPLMPETLRLFLKTSGFEVEKTELLHPFPEEQLFAGRVADEELARRLDELINGPRDFTVWARKPDSTTA